MIYVILPNVHHLLRGQTKSVGLAQKQPPLSLAVAAGAVTHHLPLSKISQGFLCQSGNIAAKRFGTLAFLVRTGFLFHRKHLAYQTSRQAVAFNAEKEKITELC